MTRVSKVERPIKPHDFTLPEYLTLWRRQFTAEERIKLINPAGFPKEAILRGLGLSDTVLSQSFGICVPEEIAHRQSLLRVLMKNRDLARFIKERPRPATLPNTEQRFTEYFNPDREHNPFWIWVHDLLGILEREQDSPVRLRLFEQGLRDSLGLEANEKEMATWILDRVNSIAVIEGIAEIDVDYLFPSEDDKKKGGTEGYRGRLIKIDVLGHQMYSSAIVEAPEETDYPEWARKKFHWLQLTGVHLLARKWVNFRHRLARKRAFREMVISKASGAVKRDVTDALVNRIAALELSPILPPLRFHVAFAYSKEGLKLRIFGIDPLHIDVLDSFVWSSFAGYNKRQRGIVETARFRFAEMISKMYTARRSNEIINDFRTRASEAIDTWFSAPSPGIDGEHRWHMLSTLYNSPVCLDTYTKAREIRVFASNHFSTLIDVLNVANIISVKAANLNTPLCFPTIADDSENIVSFKEIFPIHLLPTMNGHKPIPIRGLDRSDGQIICLTGANDGGKTVAGESILDNIWIAQSGLPVFGRDVSLNIKEVLGSVFIQSSNGYGGGSTFRLLAEQIKNLLQGIAKIDGNKVVVVLDEVGTGTQEDAGFDLGKKLLTTLQAKGASVFFITQITKLAEFAESNLGATCFKLDRKHRISAGIGTGEAGKLIKDIGLEKLLSGR